MMKIEKHFRLITIPCPSQFHSELTKLKRELHCSLQDLVILAIATFIENRERRNAGD